MNDLSKIGSVLRHDGVPWYSNPGGYLRVKEIPPAPPWIKRTKNVTPWRTWVWSPWLLSGIITPILSLIFIPLAVMSTTSLWGLLGFPLFMSIALSPIIITKARIKKNTFLYETHSHYGRFYIEATFMGDIDMRARVVAYDQPIRIEL